MSRRRKYKFWGKHNVWSLLQRNERVATVSSKQIKFNDSKCSNGDWKIVNDFENDDSPFIYLDILLTWIGSLPIFNLFSYRFSTYSCQTYAYALRKYHLQSI